MDSSSIAIGVVLMLLFVGPIMYVIFKQNHKNNKNINNLKAIGSQHQMNLDQIELTNSLMLGLDSNNKKLLVVEPKNHMHANVIDLSKIRISKVSKNGLTQQNGKEISKLTHITLDLIKNNPSEKIAEIIFYDEDDDTSYNAETQLFLANKWDQLIKSNLSA